MLLYIIIVVVIVIVGVVLFLTMRNRLMVESVNFDNEIEDIASAFEKAFEKCYVSGLDESLFIEQFSAQGEMSVDKPPCSLTKYLSATEHEERQVADSMYLCSHSFNLGIE